MPSPSLLIAGCGDLGTAIAQQLQHQAWTLYGIRRHPESLPTSIQGIAWDMAQEAQAPQPLPPVDYVLISVAADAYTPEAYQAAYVASVRHLLANLSLAPKAIFMISSTSVYGQTQGEWIDETSPTEPTGFAGETLLAGEALVQAHPSQSVLLRCSGIYGAGRQRLLREVAAGRTAPAHPVQYSNRIHRDDCVGACVHLLQQAQQNLPLQPVYLLTDQDPAPLYEVMQWIGTQLAVPTRTQVQAPLRRNASKRCRNQALTASGYQLMYPSYREGYAPMIAAWQAQKMH